MSMTILLNQKKIDELSVEIGHENVPVLLDIFLGEMTTYIDNLHNYAGAEQLLYLKEISHALKSSAASFGADRLRELAISIDNKGKTNQLAEDGVEVSTMIEVLGDTCDVYRSWHQ